MLIACISDVAAASTAMRGRGTSNDWVQRKRCQEVCARFR